MAVEKKDIEEVAAQLGARWDEFTKKNDARITGIEQEKAKLAEQVAKHNAELSELVAIKAELEAELKSLKRPGGGSVSKAQAEHKAAFGEFMRKGHDTNLRELEKKALNTGDPEDGGYAVAVEMDREIAELARDDVVMRQECRVVPVGGVGYQKLVNLGGTGSGWVGETDPRPETSTSKLQIIKPIWGEIYANPQATQTMLDDVFFDAESWLGTEAQTEFSEQEEAAFSYGDGVNKPRGLFATPTEAKGDKELAFGKLQHVLTKGALSGDDLIRMVHALRKRYRAGAKWMMNNLTLEACRLLKDGQGNYLWRPGLELDMPALLIGYAVAENEEMPDIAKGKQPLAFGNFKRAYTIFDRMGTRVLRDPFTHKPFVGFYTTKRVGGMLENHQAVKMLQIAESP